MQGLFRKTAGVNGLWPADQPRVATGLAGPRPAPVDRGGGGWSTGPPWTGEGRAAGRGDGAMAAPVSSSRRLCGAREAVPRARTRRARCGECGASAGHAEERPGRVGFAAGRLGDGENSGEHEGVMGKGRRHAEGTRVLVVPLRGRVRAHFDENSSGAERSGGRDLGDFNGGGKL